jgi:hypothetical protein
MARTAKGAECAYSDEVARVVVLTSHVQDDVQECDCIAVDESGCGCGEGCINRAVRHAKCYTARCECNSNQCLGECLATLRMLHRAVSVRLAMHQLADATRLYRRDQRH